MKSSGHTAQSKPCMLLFHQVGKTMNAIVYISIFKIRTHVGICYNHPLPPFCCYAAMGWPMPVDPHIRQRYAGLHMAFQS